MKKLSLIILIFLISTLTYANELEERNRISDEVNRLLYQNNFSRLERIAKKYRLEESRTSSGLWKLTLFYAGFDNILPYRTKNPKAWEPFLEKANNWANKYPDSPTPYIAMSTMLIKQAWNIRGSGYAYTVNKNAWKPFYEKVAESKRVLEKSRAISSKDPHWYVNMAEIAIIESWSEKDFDSLINQGLEESPYYFELYFEAMRYYTPKWHGDAEKIERFARSALERTRDKEGYGMYARIYWAASQSQFKGRLFERSDVNWMTMKKGINDVLDKYPDQWNINNFALFSCLAKDKKQTNKLIKMIKGSPIKQAWLNNVGYYNHCKIWSKDRRAQ